MRSTCIGFASIHFTPHLGGDWTARARNHLRSPWLTCLTPGMLWWPTCLLDGLRVASLCGWPLPPSMVASVYLGQVCTWYKCVPSVPCPSVHGRVSKADAAFSSLALGVVWSPSSTESRVTGQPYSREKGHRLHILVTLGKSKVGDTVGVIFGKCTHLNFAVKKKAL